MNASSTFVAADGDGYELVMGRWSRRLATPFLDFAGIQDGERVLEVGCGTGRLAQAIVGRSSPSEVRAIDLAAAYVDYARSRNQDPRVVFDIYNEPEQFSACGWAFWRHGGVCHGHHYLGMQALADYVRARASNLFWVEGISAGSLLNEAWQYHITGDGPLAYSEHRPPGRHQYRTWDSEFGYIARSGHAPVVEGEWADYARPNAPWACWDNAPVSAPRFLNYLRVRGFGLIMTLLVKNQLIKSGNLNDPTRFRSNWSCTAGLNQGVGHQAQQWFIRQNG